MSHLTHFGGGVFRWVLQTTWQAAVLAGLILLAQRLLRNRLPPFWRYGLWLLLVVRLLVPVPPQSPFSIFNLARTAPTHPDAGNPPRSSFGVDPQVIVNSIPATTPMNIPAPTIPNVAESLENPTLNVPPGVIIMPASKTDWFGIALGGWLAGVCFFGARLVWTNGCFRSRIGGYQPIADENVTRLFNECLSAFKIAQPVRLIESEEVESPAVYGLWRKWLLLPDGVFDRFSTEELRCIFLHELAHIKRGDLGVNWLVALLQVLHWFNPVLWLAWGHMRADRELATDALALAHLRASDHTPYGETILKVLEGMTGERALPGLVGIAENKAQLKERLAAISRPGKYWKWAALAVVALIAGIGLTGAQTEKGGASNAAETLRPDLTGRVQWTNGQPLKATVFISTAGPKVGTSPFCPSCYVDCRKSASTDNRGGFKIESLDPTLIFRILVVGEGLRPKFVEHVDPAKGPINVNLEPQLLAGVPPQLILRGRVIDMKGAPIQGAPVETLGYHTKDGGGRWGEIEGLDPLAVTDARGDFLITSRKEFASLDLKVEARGFANRMFLRVPGDAPTPSLQLTEGAAITGRVIWNGNPLANVEVGVVSEDRTPENFTGDFDVGTDADGRFAFVNLPPNVRYHVYGQMKTLADHGTTGIAVVDAGGDGSTTNVGDLAVGRANRLSGRVVLKDGKAIPPNTRLNVGLEDAWDSVLVDLDKDGSFNVGAIPNDTISLSLAVPGYRFSIKNESLDLQNPFRLVGRIDHDITNLIILMEFGGTLEPQMVPPGNGPDMAPLRGADGAYDHTGQRMISGRVTGKQTGEPIASFRVTPGWPDEILGERLNPQHAIAGSNGSFVIYFDEQKKESLLRIEAPEYAPMTTRELAPGLTVYDFALTKGSGPSGEVLLGNQSGATPSGVIIDQRVKNNEAFNKSDSMKDQEFRRRVLVGEGQMPLAGENPAATETRAALAANSEFVKYMANPPWIKLMTYAEWRAHVTPDASGEFHLVKWQLQTNLAAIQPAGFFDQRLTKDPAWNTLDQTGVVEMNVQGVVGGLLLAHISFKPPAHVVAAKAERGGLRVKQSADTCLLERGPS